MDSMTEVGSSDLVSRACRFAGPGLSVSKTPASFSSARARLAGSFLGEVRELGGAKAAVKEGLDLPFELGVVGAGLDRAGVEELWIEEKAKGFGAGSGFDGVCAGDLGGAVISVV